MWEAVLGAGSTLLNTGLQAIQNRQNQKWQEKTMNTQRDWALQDWKRSADYNSVGSQINRAQAAGVSKAYALNQGNAIQAPSTATPDVPQSNRPAPQVSVTDLLNSSSIGSQIQNTQADTQQKLANVSLTTLEAATEQLEQANIQADTALKQGNYRLFQEQYELKKQLEARQLDLLNAQIDESLKRAGISDETIATMRQDRLYQKKQFRLDAKRAWNDFQRTGIMQQDADTNAYNARTNAYNSGTNRLNAYTNSYDAATRRKSFNAEKPFIGIEKSPWVYGPYGPSLGLGGGVIRDVLELLRHSIRK